MEEKTENLNIVLNNYNMNEKQVVVNEFPSFKFDTNYCFYTINSYEDLWLSVIDLRDFFNSDREIFSYLAETVMITSNPLTFGYSALPENNLTFLQWVRSNLNDQELIKRNLYF